MPVTDYFRKASNGTTRPVVTYLQSTKTNGSTTATINAATGWNTTTGVDVQIYSKDTTGAKVAGSETDWIGTLSGTTLSNLTLKAGTEPASGYPAGTQSVVICSPTASWADSLMDGILTHADQDGTLKADSVDVTAVIKDAVITNSKMVDAIKPETNFAETTFDYVASGCVITGDSYGVNLKWSMTAGVVYIGGRRVVVNALSAQDVVASKDTYIDVSNTGTVTFTGGNSVANNASSPALAASSIRLGIIVSGANIASVASINQGQENKVLPIASSIPYAVTDSLGNLICPRDPSRKVLGYRQIVTTFTGSGFAMQQVTGLSCPVIVPTGRKVRVTSGCSAWAGTNPIPANWDGTVGSGTQLGAMATVTGGGSIVVGVQTPSTANKTYNTGISGTAGTVGAVAAAIAPAYIMVELV